MRLTPHEAAVQPRSAHTSLRPSALHNGSSAMGRPRRPDGGPGASAQSSRRCWRCRRRPSAGPSGSASPRTVGVARGVVRQEPYGISRRRSSVTRRAAPGSRSSPDRSSLHVEDVRLVQAGRRRPSVPRDRLLLVGRVDRLAGDAISCAPSRGCELRRSRRRRLGELARMNQSRTRARRFVTCAGTFTPFSSTAAVGSSDGYSRAA